MKINWAMRFKNPAFWVFILTILLTNIAAALHVELRSLDTWAAVGRLLYDAIVNPAVLIPTLLSVYLGAVDYSTPGLGDSKTPILQNATEEKPL